MKKSYNLFYLFLILSTIITVTVGCSGEKDDLDKSPANHPVMPSVNLYSMTGYVTSSGISSSERASINPVKGALVFLEELAGDISTTTDENGKYTLSNIPENTYHVVAKTVEGLQMRSNPITVNQTTTTQGTISVSQPLEVTKATGSVRVTIVDNNNQTMTGNGVALFWATNYNINNGLFTITDVPESLNNEIFTVTKITIDNKTYTNVKVQNHVARIKLYEDPATSTPNIPPATGTPNIPPATGTPNIPPATGTPDIPPATGTPNIPPATGTPNIPPATGTPNIPPATGTPNIPPATGTPDIPPATGTPNIPPATGTPDIPPATGTPKL